MIQSIPISLSLSLSIISSPDLTGQANMIYLSYVSNRNSYMLRHLLTDAKEQENKKWKFPVLFQLARLEVVRCKCKYPQLLEDLYYIQCVRFLNRFHDIKILFDHWSKEDWDYFLNYQSYRTRLMIDVSYLKEIFPGKIQ